MSDGRRPGIGLRGRLSVLTAVVVTVPLLLGVFLLGTILHRVFAAQLADEAAAEAQRVAALVSVTGPAVVSVPHAYADGFRVQVVDEHGTVVAASVPGDAPFADADAGPGGLAIVGVDTWWVPGAPADDLVAIAPTTVLGERFRVLVAVSQAPAARSVDTLAASLAAAVPILVLAAAAATRFAVARTLRDVEAMRRRVAAIGDDPASLGVRVTVPTSRDEVHDLAETMNDMLDRIERGRAAQRAFVSDAGHELRSPIATVRAAVELGERDPGEWERLGPLLREQTARLGDLVDDLLTLSSIADGGLRLDRDEVDLDELLRREASRVRATTSLDVAVRPAPARVRGVTRRLTTVLRNLVDNAARHANATVQLTSATDGDHVVVRVSDDGAGIAPADRDRIFERFVRLDEARTREAGGAGLGLAIVGELVRAHGGTVRVEDAQELGGASFVVTLPCAPSDPSPDGGSKR